MSRCCGVGQVFGKEDSRAREQDMGEELGEEEPAVREKGKAAHVQ